MPHTQERGRFWERLRWEEGCELHALQTGSTSLSLCLYTTHLWAASQLHLHTCLEYLGAVLVLLVMVLLELCVFEHSWHVTGPVCHMQWVPVSPHLFVCTQTE